MSVFQRQYSMATVAATHITIPMLKAGSSDFAVGADWTPAAGDVKITKDSGAPANIGTLPVYQTNEGWEYVFTAAEITGKRMTILIVDSATKAVEDQLFLIETFGHALAMDTRHTDYIGQLLITPAGFDERTNVTSEKITRASFPDFGVIFTAATSPTEDDFDISTLVGTKIALTSDPSKYFIILGGYFFNDAGDTTTKVFGIALTSTFGITEGGATIVDTNWTGSALPEATFGDGWTFIVANHNIAYPASNKQLSMFLKEIDNMSIESATDWTSTEKANIRRALGVDGTKTAGGVKGDVQDVLDDTADMQPKLGPFTNLGDGATVGENLTALAGKTGDAASYDRTTDSQEAIRDRGDSAWSSAAMSPELLQSTTIATLASQTEFTLTAGSADDKAYQDARIVVTDSATATQKAVGVGKTYTGATKTLVLLNDPGVFTMAVGDTVDILADKSLKPTKDGNNLNVSTNGGVRTSNGWG